MPRQFLNSIAAALIMLSVSPFVHAQTTRQSAGPKGQAEKTQASDPHNLSGVWELQRQKALRMSDDVPPMTPWGLAKFNQTKPGYGPRAIAPAFGNDPIGNCDPSGWPRVIFDPVRPMEIVQIPGRVLMHFQYHEAWHTIWTDGRELPKDPDPSWYGNSVGKWDGDTLVAETIGVDERSWLDHFGDPHSDQMRVEERYRHVDPATLQLVLTITDPKTYTKPWVSETKTWKLNPKLELYDEICVPSEEQSFNQRQRDVAGGKASQ